MSDAPCPHHHKTIATTAAADTNCTAVALTEHSAAFASFQRIFAGLPPAQNVISALLTGLLARQISGNYAINAVFVNHVQHLSHFLFVVFAPTQHPEISFPCF